MLLALIIQMFPPVAGQAQVEADFQLQTYRELDAEYGLPYTRYIWVVGTNKIGFIPPKSWRISGSSDKRRLLFQHEGMKAAITMTLLSHSVIPPLPAPKEGEAGSQPKPPAGDAPKPEQWRKLLLDTFPGARVETEWESISNGARAITFDILHFPDGVRQHLRVVYVMRPTVVCEIVLRTGARISDFVGDFMTVVGTLDFSAERPVRK